jgi:hypothetical protein
LGSMGPVWHENDVSTISSAALDECLYLLVGR